MRACTCRVVFNWNLTPGVYPHEKKSDLHQSIWPEGFYDVRTRNKGILSSVTSHNQRLQDQGVYDCQMYHIKDCSYS